MKIPEPKELDNETRLPLERPPANPTPSTSQQWRVGTLVYTSGGLIALFCWLLLGDFSWSMRDRSVIPVSAWYLKQLGVPNLLFALIVSSFPALLGILMVPIFAVKSDRYRSRWGRRIPFLIVTTPIAVFGMLGIAFIPFFAKEVHAFFPEASEMVVAVACFSLFWAMFEFASLAGNAIFTALINDVVPKEMLGRFFGLFRIVSLIDGIIFNSLLMGHVPSYFTLILAVIAIFYGIGFFTMCLKIKEGEYPPMVAALTDTGEGVLIRQWRGVSGYFRECFSKPFYISVFLMLTTGALAFGPVNTFAIPYSVSVGMSTAAYGKCLSLTFAISLFLSYFIGWLCDLFHPIRVTMAAVLGYSLLGLWASAAASTQESFAVAFVLHGVLSGTYVTAAASLGPRLFPQTTFAQFASASGVLLSVCTMGLSPLVGLFIDASENQYRYTFAIGGGLTIVALIAAWKVYREFVKLGGPEMYIAP